MSEKNTGEIVIASTDADLAKKVSDATCLDVKVIGDTGYATATVDVLALTPIDWQAFTQSPAMRYAVDVCKLADELRARFTLLKKQSEIAVFEFAEGKRAWVYATFRRFARAPWPRRSKPARRAMAKLAARRGRRG